MGSKPVRFGLLLAGLLITVALAYRAVSIEATAGRVSREAVSHDRTATQALEGLLDLRGALHAYVAPGQGIEFWSGRAQQTLDGLREQLITLDAALSAGGGTSLAPALDAMDQLVTAERRARAYAARGEMLLAGDVVFTEARDLLSSSEEQLRAARNALAAADDRRIATFRQEQTILAGAAVAIWIIVALVLVPPVKPPVSNDPKIWREELAQTIKKPIPVVPAETKTAEASSQAPQAPQAPQAHP